MLEMTAASIFIMVIALEAARTVETATNYYETSRRNVPENSHREDKGKCTWTREIVLAWPIFQCASTCGEWLFNLFLEDTFIASCFKE